MFISANYELFSHHNTELQSWAKVPGTVLQYSYISVISRFPLKTLYPFQNFLAVLLPPTLYKVETRKKFWINASNIVCRLRGGVGPVWIGIVPRLLSMIVNYKRVVNAIHLHVSQKDNSQTAPCLFRTNLRSGPIWAVLIHSLLRNKLASSWSFILKLINNSLRKYKGN